MVRKHGAGLFSAGIGATSHPAMPRWMCRAAAFLLLLAGLILAAPLHAKTFDIRNYDVTLRVLADGTYRVSETLKYTYADGRFTYGVRTIPKKHIDSLTIRSITSDAAPIEDDTVVDKGDHWRVRWQFAPRRDPARFTIHYTVKGALFEDGGRNIVDWNVVGDAWTVPIRDVDAAIILPGGFAQTPGDFDVMPRGELWHDGEAWHVDFHQERLSPGEGFRVKVAFPKVIDVDETAGGDFLTLGFILAIPAFLAGLGGSLVITFLRRDRRRRGEAESAGTPPSLTPEQAAVLLGGEWQRGYAAAIFQLANDGKLVLHKNRSERGVFNRKSIEAEPRGTADPGTAPFSAAVLEILNSATPHMSQLGRYLRRDRRPFRATREILAEKGLLAPRDRAARRRGALRAVYAFVPALALLALAASAGIVWAAIPLVAFLLGIGLALTLSALRLYDRTALGERARQVVKAYLAELRDELRERSRTAPDAAAEIFFTNLPWLVLDGKVDEGWMRRFSQNLKSVSATAAVLPSWVVMHGAMPSDVTEAVRVIFKDIIPTTAAHTSGGAGAGAAGAGAAGAGAGGAGGGGAGGGGGGAG